VKYRQSNDINYIRFTGEAVLTLFVLVDIENLINITLVLYNMPSQIETTMEKIEEHLKYFPLGRSKEEIVDKLSRELDSDTIEEDVTKALEELENEGSVLKVDEETYKIIG
jgi:predicted DNA-binding protein YlxM (UPF0122 family)